jgi:hypothetical protein
VSRKGDIAGMPGDLTRVLDDPCGLRVDRIAQLTAAIEAMHRPHSRLYAVMSSSAAGLTSDPANLALSEPGITDSGSRVRSPSFV